MPKTRSQPRLRLRRKLHFSEDDLIFTAADGFDLIRIRDGTQTARVGWPSLPVVVKRFVLPAEARDVTVKVEKPVWAALRGRFTLATVQPDRPAKGLRPGESRQEVSHGRPSRLPLPPVRPGDPAYYSNLVRVEMVPEVRKMEVVEFPAAELASVSRLGGRSVVAVRLHPLRYRPRRGRVEMLTSLTLRTDYTLGRPSAKRPESSPATASADLKRLMALVDNPEDIRMELGGLETFQEILPMCPDDPSLKPRRMGPYKVWPLVEDGRVFVPPECVCLHVSPYSLSHAWSYIIITDDYEWAENGSKGARVGDLIAEFERLARWKTMKGVRARVVSISDIMANVFGTHWQPGVTRDVQEAIRNFLKYAHFNWYTRWCLLGGDVNIIPARHILGNDSNYYIAKKNAADPAAGEMYYNASGPLIRYRAPYDFTTDDLFFAVDTGEVIRYRDDAATAQPGWYWTQSDYTTKSTTVTPYIVIRGPAALLNRTFTVPQYINMIPSDFYYGSVDSPLYSQPGKHDWDNDNNGIYGWYDNGNPDGVNFSADISVGRAPVSDTATTTAFVDKVLTYEQYRDVRTDQPLHADFARKVMAVGGVWGDNWWDGSFERIRWGFLDDACQDKDNVIAQFRRMGVDADQIQRVYPDIYFVPHTESNLFLPDVDQMRSMLNDGPHYVSVSGHGWWDGCSGFSSVYPEWGVTVETLTNWPNLAIYFVDSCLTNDFDLTHWTAYNRTRGMQAGDPTNVCLGKHLVRYGNGGAVGYVGYSRDGHVGKTHEMQFWQALSVYGQDHLGWMLDRARQICSDVSAWQAYIMTLMGDPELHVWTESPRPLTVSHTSSIYGQDRLTISVYYEEAPLTDVTVTVCQMPTTHPTDKVYFNLVPELTSVGCYTFDTSGAEEGDVVITVTGKNYIPYNRVVTKVSNPVSPWKYPTGGFIYDLASGGQTSLLAASGDGTLYALSPTRRDRRGLLWARTMDGPVQDLESADGWVLAGVRKNVHGNLRLYNSNGRLLRSWNMPNEVYCVALDTAHATAYAGLLDRGVRALNTGIVFPPGRSGVRWTRTNVGTCLQLGIDRNGNVYACVTKPAPTLLKISRTNDTLWSYAIGPDWMFESRALLVEDSGVCYVSTRNRELHKVNADGTLAWKLTCGTGPNQLNASVHSLIKSGSRLYAGAGDGSVMAIASNGTVEWRRRIDHTDRTDCMALGSDVLYLGSWHGVTALDTNGNTLWSREVTGGVLSMLLKGTRLYGGSRDGWVYEINIEPTVSSWLMSSQH